MTITRRIGDLPVTQPVAANGRFTLLDANCTIELATDELRAAYEEFQHLCMLETAALALRHYFCDVDEIPAPGTDAGEDFEAEIGVPYAEAVGKNSKHYILEALVALYWELCDTQYSELDVWHDAIREFINRRVR